MVWDPASKPDTVDLLLGEMARVLRSPRMPFSIPFRKVPMKETLSAEEIRRRSQPVIDLDISQHLVDAPILPPKEGDR
jgi:hypothetical protein